LFDFFVNPDSYLNFLSWEARLQEFEFPKGAEYHDIMVPTIDTLKYTEILELLLEAKKPILVTGDSGVGKTSLIVPFLFSKRESNVITIFLNFSAKTKSKETQMAIESKLNKKGKTLFGARPNETIAIFIDDVNMPELEKEGAQPTIELLRHFIDFQGFYDRQKLFWKQVVDTTMIGCGATPSGGRNKLNPRYVRHHMVLCLP
jgi:dynein heavy chain, axonemal